MRQSHAFAVGRTTFQVVAENMRTEVTIIRMHAAKHIDCSLEFCWMQFMFRDRQSQAKTTKTSQTLSLFAVAHLPGQ